MNTLFLVAITGGIGAAARYAFSLVHAKLPVGILLANTLAAAIVAYAMNQSGEVKVIMVAGIAGGLSTFSTLIANTVDLWLKGKWSLGWWNLALNIAIPSTIAALISAA